MDFSIFGSGTDIGTLALGLVLAGVLAGLAAGTLGVGGGLILVPALYVVLSDFGTAEGSRMAVAAGTALAAMVPAALMLLHRHLQHNECDLPALRRTAPWIAVAAAGGAALLCIAPYPVVVIAFAVVALAAAVLLFLVKDGRAWLRHAPGRIASAALALIGAFTGTGLSAVAVPGLHLSGATPQRAAAFGAGYDAIAGTVGAIVAVIVGWGAQGVPDRTYGYVNLSALAVVAPAMFIAATFTAPFAAQIDTARLRKLCAAFLLFGAAKMLMAVWG